MQEVGLYLMYDMRSTYMNSTSVTEQVNAIKTRPNPLLWYTGDEPDGTSDPLNATTITYDLIYGLGGYHPVSLVLNCQDYYWPSYTAGTDVVMQDVYMVGNNVTWSNEWNTTRTPTTVTTASITAGASLPGTQQLCHPTRHIMIPNKY